MALALECGGAPYHPSAPTRDRDRLRQEQLERLGWTFHRIWSQDWFANKERETERAVAAYRSAVAAADAPQRDRPAADRALGDQTDIAATWHRYSRPPI